MNEELNITRPVDTDSPVIKSTIDENFKTPNADMHKLSIECLDNGFIIKVGCKTFVLEGDTERLLTNINNFYRNYYRVTTDFWRNNQTLQLL